MTLNAQFYCQHVVITVADVDDNFIIIVVSSQQTDIELPLYNF